MANRLGQVQLEAWDEIIRCNGALTRDIDRRLNDECDISLQTYQALLALEKAKDHRLRMTDLAQALYLDASSLTRFIDRLERKGLVSREAHPRDRRSIFAVLTQSGMTARQNASAPYHDALYERFGRHLSDDAARAVRDALAALRSRNGALS